MQGECKDLLIRQKTDYFRLVTTDYQSVLMVSLLGENLDKGFISYLYC